MRRHLRKDRTIDPKVDYQRRNSSKEQGVPVQARVLNDPVCANSDRDQQLQRIRYN